MFYLLFKSQLKFPESTSPLFSDSFPHPEVFGWSPTPLDLTPIPCGPLHFANCSGAPGSYKLLKWLCSHGMNYRQARIQGGGQGGLAPPPGAKRALPPPLQNPGSAYDRCMSPKRICLKPFIPLCFIPNER